MPQWIRERLYKGDRLIGTFTAFANRMAVDVLAASGFDVIGIDEEHTPLDRAQVADAIAASDAQRLPAVVRLAQNDPVRIFSALDAGAAGIIAPRVNSASEAEAVARAAHYPPRGERGLGPGRASQYGYKSGEYLEQARRHTLVGVQIETRAAVEDLDAMLAVDGVDLYFVGPSDLFMSYGLSGPSDPELLRIVADIHRRTIRAGKIAGMFAVTPQAAASYAKDGVGFVLLRTDTMFLGEAAGNAVNAYRAAMKG